MDFAYHAPFIKSFKFRPHRMRGQDLNTIRKNVLLKITINLT